MTETREPYLYEQTDLFGNVAPLPGMNRDEKVAYILERWPATRNDDRELMLRFWEVFDSLDEVLGSVAADRFRYWFRRATHPETIRRGRAGIQKLRTGAGAMRPNESETKRRRALDGAGPPR